jgi:hypothetical protein
MLTNENPAGQGGVSELGHAAKQTSLEHKAQASCAQANALAPAGKSSNKKSWRDVIKVHPAADLFPMMSEAELRELGEDIKKNGLKTDIIFWSPTIDSESAYLLDGRNRLDAMEAVGLLRLRKDDNNWGWLLEQSSCKGRVNLVEGSTGADPYALAVSLNIHRRHLTGEQKRELIAKLLKAKPEASNRSIGAQIKVDDKTVASVRRELESTAEIPQLEKTIGADGKARKQPARKPAQDSEERPPTVAEEIETPEDVEDEGDSEETCWRRGLLYRATNAAGEALYEDWSSFNVDQQLVDAANTAADSWVKLARYLRELRDAQIEERGS